VGFSACTHFNLPNTIFRSVDWTLAFVRHQNVGHHDHNRLVNTTNMGTEIVLAEVFALRFGNAGRVTYDAQGFTRWGVGLRSPEGLSKNSGISLDYVFHRHRGDNRDQWSIGFWGNL
jgi:hypothetical protein